MSNSFYGDPSLPTSQPFCLAQDDGKEKDWRNPVNSPRFQPWAIFMMECLSYSLAVGCDSNDSRYQLTLREKYINKPTIRNKPTLPKSNEKSCSRMITKMNV